MELEPVNPLPPPISLSSSISGPAGELAGVGEAPFSSLPLNDWTPGQSRFCVLGV